MITEQDAKEFLKGVMEYDKIVKDKIKEINNVRLDITSLKSSNSGYENVQSSRNYDKIGDSIVRLEKYEIKLSNSIEELCNRKDEVMDIIDKVEDLNCRQLLYKRYFQFKTWEQISCEMKKGNGNNYTSRGVKKLHGKALRQTSEVLERAYGEEGFFSAMKIKIKKEQYDKNVNVTELNL